MERTAGKKIDKIIEEQLNPKTDLPPGKRVLINGKKRTICEIPFPTNWIENNSGYKVYAYYDESRSRVSGGGRIPLGGYYGLQLPENERVYIEGRVWTI